MKRWALIFTLGLCVTLFGGTGFSVPGFDIGHAWASGDDDHGSDKDDDDDDDDDSENSGKKNKLGAVRDAVANNEILPLSELKAIVVARFGSNIVDIEIEQEKGLWIYEFKIISTSGRLVEVYLDAETGRILEVEND